MNKNIYQDKILYPDILWQRPVHKYNATAGKVMILAGSKNMSGEAILACEAVFRSGTGILLLGFPESLKSLYRGILPEAMTLELPETPGHTVSKRAEKLILENSASCDVLIIGSGLSENAETTELVWELIFSSTKPLVLCDSAITALCKGIAVIKSKESADFTENYLKQRPNEMIAVISEGEARKLAKALSLEANDADMTISLATALSCTVVVASKQPVIATSTGDSIITRLEGPEHVTGDNAGILSSIIGSFVAQNPKAHAKAVTTAVYLYSLAGEIAAKEGNKSSIPVSEIVRHLQGAIKKAEE